jgi:hypothetical protein
MHSACSFARHQRLPAWAAIIAANQAGAMRLTCGHAPNTSAMAGATA